MVWSSGVVERHARAVAASGSATGVVVIEELEVVGEVDDGVAGEVGSGVLSVVEVEELEIVGEIDEAIAGEVGGAGRGRRDAGGEVEDALADDPAAGRL